MSKVAPSIPSSSDGWRSHWYPLAFGQDLGTDEVRPVALHGEPLALFRDPQGRPRCVVDRCPHRAAKLSDGQVHGGRLECLYHGWQFAGDGRCLHIPQLSTSQPMPAKASVTAFEIVEIQGMIWLWPGSREDADPTRIPTVAALDAEDCSSIDFAIDLPYEQTFLIENVVDIAHIHVAHDGVRGGGHRHMALPLSFEVSERTAEGFSGSYRSFQDDAPAASDLEGARMEFHAPNLVHYTSVYQDADLVSGLALYSLPMGGQRCRLLYRAYSNFWPARTRWRPRWLEHWTQCTILEQDMDVVVGQAAQTRHLGKPPKDLWLPLKSSDAFVLAYRRWIDEFASSWPFTVGFARVRPAETDPSPPEYNRYDMHTRLCASCSWAEAWCRRLRTPLTLAVVLFLALAAATSSSWISWTAAALAVGSALVRVLMEQAAARFR